MDVVSHSRYSCCGGFSRLPSYRIRRMERQQLLLLRWQQATRRITTRVPEYNTDHGNGDDDDDDDDDDDNDDNSNDPNHTMALKTKINRKERRKCKIVLICIRGRTASTDDSTRAIIIHRLSFILIRRIKEKHKEDTKVILSAAISISWQYCVLLAPRHCQYQLTPLPPQSRKPNTYCFCSIVVGVLTIPRRRHQTRNQNQSIIIRS